MKLRLFAYLLGIMLLAGSIGVGVHTKADGDPPPICPVSICPPN
jgi:hypothetical protein